LGLGVNNVNWWFFGAKICNFLIPEKFNFNIYKGFLWEKNGPKLLDFDLIFFFFFFSKKKKKEEEEVSSFVQRVLL
jgi:hypothetical protein